MNTYKSFWMGGFEGADHINAREQTLDMVTDSGHLAAVESHYSKLAKLGILTVRESIGWRTVKPTLLHTYDWTRVRVRAEAARKHGLQIIWTFMHYGTPTGVNLLDDTFLDDFFTYARDAAKVLREYDKAPVFNLINEISFLAWATSQTDYMWPYRGQYEGAGGKSAKLGFETKCRLVLEVLLAMHEIRAIIPSARFLHVEPLLHIVPPADRPDLEGLAQEVRDHQWQTWELLRGSMEPRLGGYPEALDLMGVNYYYNGQMEVETNKHLEWETPDPRRAPFSELLKEVWGRYQRPLIVSETGHIDDGRARWLDHVLRETQRTIAEGTPLQGLCIYPIIDRPCWHNPDTVIHCGLLDHLGSVKTLRRWQKTISLGTTL